jgi:hypothetical protein
LICRRTLCYGIVEHDGGEVVPFRIGKEQKMELLNVIEIIRLLKVIIEFIKFLVETLMKREKKPP